MCQWVRLQIAAWNIHKYLQKQGGIEVGDKPQLPMFYTEIDEVSEGLIFDL